MVFTFQSIMFVSLGFLCAVLLGFVIAPAFWKRAVRLTTDRIRASLPLTEAEISAERDKLRAENAIRVHQLTSIIEQGRLSDARQRVEINRRDGTINALERRLTAFESEVKGSENARRVLEATITQRIPEIESRLIEARQLLAKRDSEMKSLQADTAKTYRALDEAMQMNAQQRAEIDRLKMSLAGQGVRLQNSSTGAETDTALRAEIEKLRARSREQAAQLAKLQSKPDNNRDGAAKDAVEPRGFGRADGAKAPVGAKGGAQDLNLPEVLQRKIDAQAATIKALEAQVGTADAAGSGAAGAGSVVKGGEAVLRSRIAAAEKDLGAKDKAIAALQVALATANERIARQASHYQDELRRLGSRASSPVGMAGPTGMANGAGPHVEHKGQDADSRADGADAPSVEQLVTSAVETIAEETPQLANSPSDEPRPSKTLEERLAAVGEATANESVAAYDFDQHLQSKERLPEQAVEPPPRSKLMDRIAGLAKR